MPKEGEPIPVTAIRINLQERSITFEAQDQPVAKVSFSAGTIFFQSTPAQIAEPTPAEQLPAPAQTAPTKEKEKTVVVTGRLKTQPKEGNPDSKGRPTAYARLAVHDDTRSDARLYLATFHRHTAKIALALPKESQITAEGYPHLAEKEGRLDTFSVINLINYPGRKEKAGG